MSCSILDAVSVVASFCYKSSLKFDLKIVFFYGINCHMNLLHFEIVDSVAVAVVADSCENFSLLLLDDH
jgi:hypothetical protein